MASVQHKGQNLAKICGPPYYASPEVACVCIKLNFAPIF